MSFEGKYIFIVFAIYVQCKYHLLFLWKHIISRYTPLLVWGLSVVFPLVLKASLNRHRQPAQAFAGRLLVLARADGGGIERRHGEPREEETEPFVWPQRPAQLPGQRQVRSPLRDSAVVSWAGSRGVCASEAQQRGSAEPRLRTPPPRRCRDGSRSALRNEACCRAACWTFGRVWSRRTDRSSDTNIFNDVV